MKAVVHTDGGCRPTNPGHSGFACIIKLGGKTHTISRYLGIRTNNYAEYAGVITGIKYAHELGATELELITDSQLIKHQIDGNYRVKHPELKPLHSEARKLLEKHFLDFWKITWCRRELNTIADAACTAAIFYGMNQNPFVPQKIKDKRPGKIVDPFL